MWVLWEVLLWYMWPHCVPSTILFFPNGPAERGSWPQGCPTKQGGAALARTVLSLSRARDDRLWWVASWPFVSALVLVSLMHRRVTFKFIIVTKFMIITKVKSFDQLWESERTPQTPVKIKPCVQAAWNSLGIEMETMVWCTDTSLPVLPWTDLSLLEGIWTEAGGAECCWGKCTSD